MQSEPGTNILKTMFQKDLCSCGDAIYQFSKESDNQKSKEDFMGMLSLSTLQTMPNSSQILSSRPVTEVVWGHGADIALLNMLIKNKPFGVINFSNKLKAVSNFIRNTYQPVQKDGVNVKDFISALETVQNSAQKHPEFECLRFRYILLANVDGKIGDGTVCSHRNKNGMPVGYTIALLPDAADNLEHIVNEALRICYMDTKLYKANVNTHIHNQSESTFRIYNLDLRGDSAI